MVPTPVETKELLGKTDKHFKGAWIYSEPL